MHTAEHLASSMFYLGAAKQSIPRAKLFASGASPVAGAYAVVHPFASAAEKTWPAAWFVEVARHLVEGGVVPVFIAGAADDVTPFSEFRVISAHLNEVKNLLSSATVFIGNDSGPAHMAAAFGVPVVVLYGPSDPVVWAPWRVPAQALVSAGPIESISPGEVIRALDEVRVAR